MPSNLIFDIIANDKASKILDNIGSSLEGQGKKWDSLKVAGAASTAVLGTGVAALAAMVHTGTQEAKDASAGQAQLEAGIKSTGNAAGVSVDGLQSLATSIQNMSGQTDDSIVASEQMLLTFTNIKNNGPDKIFDQATLATANMAAKMGGDASGMAVKLGKALNDPVAGLTALSKVGVQFSASQKETIKSMVATGDVAGAQKVILSELNTQFGGAAKAAGESLPGQMARGQRSFEDLSQSLVETAMPAMTGFANAGIKVLTWMNDNKTAAAALAITIGALALGIKIYANWTKISAAGTAVWTAAQWAWNAASAASGIGLIIIAIAALVAGIVWVATKTTFFQDLWSSAWSTITSFTTVAGSAIGGVFSGIWSVMQTVFGWSPLGLIVNNFGAIVGFISGLPGQIARVASGMWDGIKNSFRGAINFIIGGWNSIHLTLPSIDTHIPGIGKIGGFTMRVPQLPYLASGGVADRATLAVLGEAGSEAVLPFDRAQDFADMVAKNLNGAGSAGAGITEHTTVVQLDGREIYRTVKRYEKAEATR